MTDKELIAQLRAPDTRRKAFEVMVNQYSQVMYWRIRHMVVRHEDADDVLQNAFMKAWMKLDDFRGDAAVSTWLCRICINEALDFMRKRREQLSNDGEMAMLNTLKADQYFDGDETEIKLQQAIETLPDAQKATFTMRYYEDLPYKEMAAILGTSEAGLKTNYHLAVKKIKKILDN